MGGGGRGGKKGWVLAREGGGGGEWRGEAGLGGRGEVWKGEESLKAFVVLLAPCSECWNWKTQVDKKTVHYQVLTAAMSIHNVTWAKNFQNKHVVRRNINVGEHWQDFIAVYKKCVCDGQLDQFSRHAFAILL